MSKYYGKYVVLLATLVVLAGVVPSPSMAGIMASDGVSSAGSSGTYTTGGADPPAISFTGVTQNFTDGSWSLGFEFSPTTALDVSALGFYNANLTGGSVGLSNCTGCGEVGLYNSTGTLLVSGQVTSSGAQVGDFNYVSVPTTGLIAGQDYYLLAETGNADYTFDPNGLGINPDINWIGELETRGSSLTFTTNGEANEYPGWGIYGPNVELSSSVPEPGSLMLIALGLVGLGLIRWTRRASSRL
ncbi:MAG: PEP-CTERM sorting domain-containing protein [Steroidobacteraceae bacterium]